MICKIAEQYIDIHALYPSTERFCAAYVCADAPHVDFSVEMCEADIDREAERDPVARRLSRPYLEQIALCRKICAEMLCRSSFLMHCAVIEYEGRGYAFSAPSGTGKTTHIRLWQKLFGRDRVTIINGDKPILRCADGKIYAHGTPWCGKEGYNTNTCVPLHALCFLERAEHNSISPLSDTEAMPKLFGQLMIADSADLATQLELLDRLVTAVPMYRLRCNMDIEAARVAYEGTNRK